MTSEMSNLLLVEDHLMVRESVADHVRVLFNSIHVLEAGTLEEAQALASAWPLDLILLDLKLPDAVGFSALTTLRKLVPQVPIVVLSGMADASLSVAMRSLGASDVLGKSARRGELLPVLTPWLNPVQSRKPERAAAGKPILTSQQLIVLEYTLAGLSNKEIAGETGLSAGTVRNLLSDVFLSFDVNSRAQLLAMFQR